MNSVLLFYIFFVLIGRISANTETYQINIPRDFPISNALVKNDTSKLTFLQPDAQKLVRVDLESGQEKTIHYIKLVGFEPLDSLFYKFCWKALDPVNIKISDKIVAPDESFIDDEGDGAEIYLVIEIVRDYYPVLPEYEISFVNISIHSSKVAFGVPLDLIDIIKYITSLLVVSIPLSSFVYKWLLA